MATIEAANWSGAIPVVLSLAPTSLSSPTIPPPLHKMVSRQSYLHTALEKEVKRLYKFAPTILSLPSMVQTEPGPEEAKLEESIKTKTTTIEKYPVCWFEDEETGLPLRWHLFCGILFDLRIGKKDIPWKLKLHFNNYPSNQILPLDLRDDVLTVVERTYKNSLKQALFLQNGSSKVAMSLTKQSHQRIWDSIVMSKYQFYQEVDKDLQSASSYIPVRVLVNSKPATQKPCSTKDAESWTVGRLLSEWLPNLFVTSDEGTKPTEKTKCCVQGLPVPLSAPLVQVWKRLSHPDHFLYLVVIATEE